MNMDAQGAEDQTSQKEKHIGWHVVAFLDLLGQQDTLRKLTALPDIENQEEVAAFKQKVGELYKPLYALQTFFKASIKPFIEGSIDETVLLPSERELLQQFRSTPIFYRHFSDSLIVHIPLRNDIGKFQCRAIYSVLAATAATFLSCMVHSWAIRGGIELGLAMDIGEGEIYGPALARAYKLESRVAQYPRIVIGEELIRYLQMVAGNQALTVEEKAHAEIAAKSLGLLAVDDDGCTFLDWLGSGIRTAFQQHTELVHSAYNFIIQESIKHKEDRNSKLGFRYSLLRNYVESRLQDWGFSLQSE
jgi:hypothetical protein